MKQHTRIHKPLSIGIVDILMEVFNQQNLADRVINASLKENNRWGSRDRKFVAHHSYQIIRNWRMIKFCGEINDRKIKEEADFWLMLGTWLAMDGIELPAWEEFEGISPESIGSLKVKALQIPKVAESVTDWLYEYGEEQLGERWLGELKALNQEAPVFLRVNQTHSNITECLKELRANAIECEEANGAIKLLSRRKYTHLPIFKSGKVETQDLGSQEIAKLLNPQSGEFVIDACAGAGGKSLHAADLMKNKGKILALDIHAKKLEELQKRANRSRFDIINTQRVAPAVVKAYSETADKLLLDVPCTGSGTFRRNVDAKWKLKPSFMEEIVPLQAEILQDYASMLKKAGQLVYATCSIFPVENKLQVTKFLANNEDYKLLEEKQLWPSEGEWDGFYMALIQKKP